MRTISRAGLAIIIAAALPATALAQANHNTARSNKNTVAPPAGTGLPSDTTTADVAPANHNTARSNKSTVAAPAGDTTAPGNTGNPARSAATQATTGSKPQDKVAAPQ
jgi:hypothetical protein